MDAVPDIHEHRWIHFRLRLLATSENTQRPPVISLFTVNHYYDELEKNKPLPWMNRQWISGEWVCVDKENVVEFLVKCWSFISRTSLNWILGTDCWMIDPVLRGWKWVLDLHFSFIGETCFCVRTCHDTLVITVDILTQYNWSPNNSLIRSLTYRYLFISLETFATD